MSSTRTPRKIPRVKLVQICSVQCTVLGILVVVRGVFVKVFASPRCLNVARVIMCDRCCGDTAPSARAERRSLNVTETVVPMVVIIIGSGVVVVVVVGERRERRCEM